LVFGFVGRFIEGFGEFLRPLKRVDTKPILNRMAHPVHVRKLMKAREVVVVYIGDGKNILLAGGMKFANVVFVPEFLKAWVIMPNSEFHLEDKPAYLCDKSLGYTLQITDETLNFNPNDHVTAEQRASLGLPDTIIAVQSDTMGQIAASKWNQGFEESKGQVLIFLFGFFAAMGLMLALIVLIVMIVVIAGMM
jgi:hypothetical protein